MLALSGNTSVYLQHAHVRIRSILIKPTHPATASTPDVRIEPGGTGAAGGLLVAAASPGLPIDDDRGRVSRLD
jgi:hypothetical protein